VSSWQYPEEGHNLNALGLKRGRELEGGWGLLWNSSFGSIISHTIFNRNKIYFSAVLYLLHFLTILVAIFGQKLFRTCRVVKKDT